MTPYSVEYSSTHWGVGQGVLDLDLPGGFLGEVPVMEHLHEHIASRMHGGNIVSMGMLDTAGPPLHGPVEALEVSYCVKF